LSDRKKILTQAAKHWSSVAQRDHSKPLINRWWLDKRIVSHINKKVCGEPLLGLSAGFHQRIGEKSPQGGFKHGISIGCGIGSKEFDLVRRGIVNKFDLFELSDIRVKQGKQRAKELGISDKINYYCLDGFLGGRSELYDIVYWNNSLHHMLDVDDAIQKSKSMLVQDGLFAMDDFVGPSRFQWTPTNIAYANNVRNILDKRFFELPQGAVATSIDKPTIEEMLQLDPTEAADSENILPSLNKHFDDLEITLTGGIIYHTALNDILSNFTELDSILLESLLILDDALTELNETHYSVAFAWKV